VDNRAQTIQARANPSNAGTKQGAGRSLGLPILGRLLGHSQPTTTQRYAHLADDPVRSAANTIAAEIDAAMSGKHDKRNKLGESATVTRLRK
jgi:hypothetical protein